MRKKYGDVKNAEENPIEDDNQIDMFTEYELVWSANIAKKNLIQWMQLYQNNQQVKHCKQQENIVLQVIK